MWPREQGLSRTPADDHRGASVVMYPWSMAREKGAFAPGTKVGVRFSGRVTTAYVIEDLGVFRGRHILRVHLGEWDDPEAIEYELPEDELEPLPAAA